MWTHGPATWSEVNSFVWQDLAERRSDLHYTSIRHFGQSGPAGRAGRLHVDWIQDTLHLAWVKCSHPRADELGD